MIRMEGLHPNPPKHRSTHQQYSLMEVNGSSQEYNARNLIWFIFFLKKNIVGTGISIDNMGALSTKFMPLEPIADFFYF